jgi:hypothetical protein
MHWRRANHQSVNTKADRKKRSAKSAFKTGVKVFTAGFVPPRLRHCRFVDCLFTQLSVAAFGVRLNSVPSNPLSAADFVKANSQSQIQKTRKKRRLSTR